MERVQKFRSDRVEEKFQFRQTERHLYYILLYDEKPMLPSLKKI